MIVEWQVKDKEYLEVKYKDGHTDEIDIQHLVDIYNEKIEGIGKIYFQTEL